MASTKPVFGPPPNKSIFATKWCTTFRDLINAMYRDGPSQVATHIAKIEEYDIALQAEGQALGFKEEDWPMDVNLPPKHMPGDKEFHYTNPFTAGFLTKNLAREMKDAMDAGMFE